MSRTIDSDLPMAATDLQSNIPAVDERIDFGEICVARGLITSEQLQEAVTEHHRTGQSLEEILVQTGAISEQQRLTVLVEHFAVMRVDIVGYQPEADLSAHHSTEAHIGYACCAHCCRWRHPVRSLRFGTGGAGH
jgi:hypothetical protein